MRCAFLGCGDVFSRPFSEALQQWGLLAAAGGPADLAVIASHGRVLSAEELAQFPRGVITMHPSLLPLYRGAAPAEARGDCLVVCGVRVVLTSAQWQLLDGVAQSGVTAVLATARVDAGPVLAQEAFAVCEATTRDGLLREAAARGVPLLGRLLGLLEG